MRKNQIPSSLLQNIVLADNRNNPLQEGYMYLPYKAWQGCILKEQGALTTF
ncbi:MAG: hypothetical protein WDA18_00035 [Candidatus Ratteibacteria bacterium]